MGVRHNHWFAIAARLALCALTLAACTPAATLEPTSVPTETPLPTALPPTPAATEPAPTAVPNIPVPATSITFSYPEDIAVDADGTFYVALAASCGCDTSSALPGGIDKIDPSGLLTRLTGVDYGFSGDGGPAISAAFSNLAGLAIFDDNLYAADSTNNRVRRIDRDGTVSTVVGSGPAPDVPGGFAGDGGLATNAMLSSPVDIAFDAAGNMYIADTGNSRIRKVDGKGIITTIAGTGQPGFSGDGGPATAAQISNTQSLAVDAAGNLYLTDNGNNRVRKVDPQGIMTTVAGGGPADATGDGSLATDTMFFNPTGLAIDGQGNVYVATIYAGKSRQGRILKIDAQGLVTTVAGVRELLLVSDGGPATGTTIRNPAGLAFDAQGNLYIADVGNQRVRKVDRRGIITTVAGGAP